MTEGVRLTMVAHAMTDAMVAMRFPDDEPLNGAGRRRAEAAAGLDVNRQTRQLAGPERRALQTTELPGLRPVVELRLVDLDYGR